MLVALAHVILLFLVTAENADFSDIGIEEAFEDSVAEGAGATSYLENISIKHYLLSN